MILQYKTKIYFYLFKVFIFFPLLWIYSSFSVFPEVNLEIKKVELKNGIRLIMIRNPVTPTFSISMKIAAGSSNESFDDAGAAHFLEHLLFKGNDIVGSRNYAKEKEILYQIYSDGEKIDIYNAILKNPDLSIQYRQEIKEKIKKARSRKTYYEKYASRFIIPEEDSYIYSLAGQSGYNAYTSVDLTSYKISLPKNRLELWAYVESNRFRNPVFREFYTERKVIEEERKMRYDSNPRNLLYEFYLKNAFGFSPYGKPVIGFKSSIPNLRYERIKDFYWKNYIPSRMVIAISGDIHFGNTEKIISHYFSRIPARENPPFPVVEAETSVGLKRAWMKSDAEPYMIVGWHKPSINHSDEVYFEYLEWLLTGSLHSRLKKRLITQEKLVSDIEAVNGIPGDKLDNQFTLFIHPYQEKDYLKIEKIINEELKKIIVHGISSEEEERMVNQIRMDYALLMENNDRLVDIISFYEVMFRDYEKIFKTKEELKHFSNERLRKVVQKWFIQERKTVVMIQKPENI